MRETMAEPSPLPHQRRRRHIFVKIVSTLCLCGSLAVLIDLGADEATRSSLLTVLKSRPGGSSSASASATSSSARNFIGGRAGVSANFRLLGGVNKIKPGRTLKAALLKTHLRFNPFPTTAGQQVNPVESNESSLLCFSRNQFIAFLTSNPLPLVFLHFFCPFHP